MSKNLYTASYEWARRPADERFASLEDLRDAVAGRKSRAAVAQEVPFVGLRVARTLDGIGTEGEDLRLVGPTGASALLTNWSFGQICKRISAPAEHYGTLPVRLVEEAVNFGIGRLAERDALAEILFDRGNGHGLTVRGITSERYTRIWDVNVVDRLIDLRDRGWRVPPARPAFADQPGTRPATEADVLSIGEFGLSVNVGDLIAPAGLYAGDRDMFAFLVNEQIRIADGTDHGLSRGFFLQNSEVGNGRSLSITTFLYRHVCGNHIVWDARGVNRVALRHVSDADERFSGELATALERYTLAAASEDENRIRLAKAFELGPDREKVVEVAFQKTPLAKKTIEAGFDEAEQNDENPRSAWGLAQGLTRVSQRSEFADKRTAIDAGTGAILRLAF